MTRIARYILLIISFIISCNILMANDGYYTIDNVPNVHLQNKNAWVTDPSNIISSVDKDNINNLISTLNKNKGVEIAVVILPSIGDNDINDFANRLFEKWGIGNKKTDNGLLYLIVMDKRQQRIEVGYGLEGDITDAYCITLETRIVAPFFKNNEYAQGILQAIRHISDKINTSNDIVKSSRRSDKKENTYLFIFYIVVVFLVGLRFLYNAHTLYGNIKTGADARKTSLQKINSMIFIMLISIMGIPLALILFIQKTIYRKKVNKLSHLCDSCHNNTIRKIPIQELKTKLSRMQQVELDLRALKFECYHCDNCNFDEIHQYRGIEYSKVLVCPHCKARTLTIDSYKNIRDTYGNNIRRFSLSCHYCDYSETRDEKDDDDNSGSLLPILIGSALLGSRSVGGFGSGGFSSGGSFGGGLSGGGGATSSW